MKIKFPATVIPEEGRFGATKPTMSRPPIGAQWPQQQAFWGYIHDEMTGYLTCQMQETDKVVLCNCGLCHKLSIFMVLQCVVNCNETIILCQELQTICESKLEVCIIREL